MGVGGDSYWHKCRYFGDIHKGAPTQAHRYSIYERGNRQALAAFPDGKNDCAIVGINGVWSTDPYGY